ncbi:hypothetical protein [Spirulina sp. 06S082]|uniref:hypothetical protein n=1 Tax=Spirulina sp. 06S082 TaxID=3110248 RepID=UPI002B22075F|nr:hypothetical protein [Spirulina sp. 06S082]MEA5471000.1 hypothetical protein [Spirulina sp. 06S082]
MEIVGTIERQEIGVGTWALVAESGETYELKDAPSALCQNGIKVKINGEIRDDVMTLAMIGPVLEVKSFEAIAS